MFKFFMMVNFVVGCVAYAAPLPNSNDIRSKPLNNNTQSAGESLDRLRLENKELENRRTEDRLKSRDGRASNNQRVVTPTVTPTKVTTPTVTTPTVTTPKLTTPTVTPTTVTTPTVTPTKVEPTRVNVPSSTR